MKKYNRRRREFIESYLPLFIDEHPNILSIGCGKYDFLREIIGLSCGSYTSIDVDKKLFPRIDYEVDICNISTEVFSIFKKDPFDVILAFDVMEHVSNPFRMIVTTAEILKPNGLLLITTPFDSPIHETEVVKDYWRITETGYRQLLRGFNHVKIWFDGPPEKPKRYYVEARKK